MVDVLDDDIVCENVLSKYKEMTWFVTLDKYHREVGLHICSWTLHGLTKSWPCDYCKHPDFKTMNWIQSNQYSYH